MLKIAPHKIFRLVSALFWQQLHQSYRAQFIWRIAEDSLRTRVGVEDIQVTVE